MLEKKYFRKIQKLVIKYAPRLRGYRLTITDQQAEIKLSYHETSSSTESVWICCINPGWGEERNSAETVYFSIKNELETKFPQVQ